MKASEINLNRFLAQTDTQFIVPVYQRNYDWTISQCKQLLEDIEAIGNDENASSHFIGSIVYIHDDVYSVSGIRELSIIDGQQRLTTLTLLYIAILSIAKGLNKEQLVNRIIETYLINKFAQEEKLKLRPTENNDKALKYLLRDDATEEYYEYSRLVENYNFFKTKMNEYNIETVLKGINKLVFVEISLERDKDDPQRIFESLNSTGLELSQADLIRNYILMGLKNSYQKLIYENYWRHIELLATQKSLNVNRVSDFIRDYLTIENREIPNKNKVYIEFKKKFYSLDIGTLERVLAKIKRYASYYNKLINPENESDKEIREQIKYINKLEINVAYPFLLEVYSDYTNNVINKEIFIEILELVQSFTWRRFIVGLPTNALNKIFMRLYEDIITGDYIVSLQKSLIRKKGAQRFPNNTEVLSILKEKDMYGIQSKNRNYFLERLENFQNNEPVIIDGNSDITIEHIFPQNPDAKWKVILGDTEYNFIKENYLNTIANLTLSGNNGKLGNKYFTDKRDMNIDGKEQGYKYSRLWLNKYLSSQDKWGSKEINERYDMIAKRFIRIWKYTDISLVEDINYEEVNIFDAEDPTFKKLDYAIFFDQKINVRTVTELYLEVMKTLFELQPQVFFTTELTDKINITKTRVNLRDPLPINDTYFIEANIDSKSKLDRIKLALSIIGITDELSIKYSN